MYTTDNYLMAESAEEALAALRRSPQNKIIAGGTWLRMGTQRIGTLIDLTKLGIDRIEMVNGEVRIGAMTSQRAFENDSMLNEMFSGVPGLCVRDVVGVQFRNTATIGAGIYSAYGFSDPLTACLALDADVEFAGAGRMKLYDFINMPRTRQNRDILLYIYLKNDIRRAVWRCFRQTATDFAIVNMCLAEDNCGDIRLAVGARPNKAVRCSEAEACIKAGDTEGALGAVSSLAFGDNMRGSAMYRRQLARVLLSEAVEELRGDGK